MARPTSAAFPRPFPRLLPSQNNAGKSNLLRFIKEVYGKPVDGRGTTVPDPLAQHLPDRPPLRLGTAEFIDSKTSEPAVPLDHRLVVRSGGDTANQQRIAKLAGKMLQAKAKLDGTDNLCWSVVNLPERRATQDSWRQAINSLADNDVYQLWTSIAQMTGGSKENNWVPELADRVPAQPPKDIPVEIIPAIRQIGREAGSSNSFDGTGLIERLAKLQNPNVHDQSDRARFNAITRFVREVVDRPEAVIEIPHDRSTILVHMDGKVLPIESLGSGIHEIVILAAAATVLVNHVVCVEEPELHLNPILQRKLIRYLQRETENQYFITTHSPALMDTPGAEVYHVHLRDGQSVVERVTSDTHRSAVCADLGYHPSDLLQANCVVWVEGPSDRIYLIWWLKAIDATLVEGIHFSVIFYGGRLASHLTNSPHDEEVEDFISLRRLNRRGVIIIDSDKDKPQKPVNATKRRLQQEFDHGPGHAWITDGREIENYVPAAQLEAAMSKVCPAAIPHSKFGRYDHALAVKLPKGKEGHAPKVEIARIITSNFSPDLMQLDLRSRLEKLKKFIHESNPRTAVLKQ